MNEETYERVMDAIDDGEETSLRAILAEFGDPDSPDVEGRTILHNAVTYSLEYTPAFVQMINVLLNEGANPNLVCRHGSSPLHVAGHRKSSELVHLLLRFGANPVLVDDRGRSGLQNSLRHPIDFEMLESLLRSAKKHSPESLPDGEMIRAEIGKWHDRTVAVQVCELFRQFYDQF